MATCDRCGNDYDRSFIVMSSNGDRHVFDCFECAIGTLAPRCERCSVVVIGHGVQAYGAIYCCAHCARGEGVDRVSDRVS